MTEQGDLAHVRTHLAATGIRLDDEELAQVAAIATAVRHELAQIRSATVEPTAVAADHVPTLVPTDGR